MGLFWFRPQQSIRTWIYRLNPRFDGAFLIPNRSINITLNVSLNPRFDGAFLIQQTCRYQETIASLNPRFDGAFLIPKSGRINRRCRRLNPRFDGAFLILCLSTFFCVIYSVLIPDLMGLFWFWQWRWLWQWRWVLIPDLMGLFWFQIKQGIEHESNCLNPRFDGAFLILKVAEVIAESAKKS